MGNCGFIRFAGFQVKCIDNGSVAVATVYEWQPDLILLDLMLPGKDGLDICRELRQNIATPIIMVTAKTEEIDRLLGLELGADDYICKPYSPREVVARVKAIFRRVHLENNKQTSKSGLLEIDNASYQAKLSGVKLDLTPVEFRLLALLSASPGRIFSREQLIDNIYQDHRIVTDRAIDSHIKNLRKKLNQAKPDTEFIRSVYGVGYAFEQTS